MSWHFSRALVEEYSAATCLDGAQSAQLSANPMPQAFLCKDRMTAFSRLSRFGMTFVPLTGSLGADLLTWFLADSRARTYPPLEMAQESTGSAPGCGEKWRESSARYDLDSSSWKIHLSLFPEDLPWSSVTLPRWGMTRNGVVYQHPTLERPINATGYGSLLPTPSASHCETRPSKTWNPKSQSGRSLGCMAATGMWPTPVASMSKGSSQNALTSKDGQDRSNDRLDHAVMASEGGQLNPTWVEWLMGWPLGWTDLKPLEMDKFQEWQRQHSGF